jgi:hypothetical protein
MTARSLRENDMKNDIDIERRHPRPRPSPTSPAS